jgi:small nuclear ribonucleoprotein (snRNP)-like protein
MRGEHEAERAGAGPLFRWVMALVAAIAALSLALIAFHFRPVQTFRPAGGIGSMQAITLSNNQVYFGTLRAIDGNQILLEDVFEGITTVNAQTNQRTTQLVRRQTNAWHGPGGMSIPDDKILFSETVGPESTVGKAIKTGGAPSTSQ